MDNFIDHHAPEMQQIKRETLKDENIVFLGECYRYINHEKKLLTTGSTSTNGLKNIADAIRFDTKTIIIMQNRYKEMSQ